MDNQALYGAANNLGLEPAKTYNTDLLYQSLLDLVELSDVYPTPYNTAMNTLLTQSQKNSLTEILLDRCAQKSSETIIKLSDGELDMAKMFELPWFDPYGDATQLIREIVCAVKAFTLEGYSLEDLRLDRRTFLQVLYELGIGYQGVEYKDTPLLQLTRAIAALCCIGYSVRGNQPLQSIALNIAPFDRPELDQSLYHEALQYLESLRHAQLYAYTFNMLDARYGPPQMVPGY